MFQLRRATALLVAIGLLACPSPQERAEDARADARAALARGDRDGALRALHLLRELRAETSVDPLELAELLVEAGEAPQAVWLLEEAVRATPERDELRIALAQAALLVGDAAAARNAVEPIAESSQKHPEALVLRSQAELRLGDANRALATLAQAEQLYPDRIEARLVRIGTLLQERRIDEARRAIEDAREPVAAADQPDALRPFEIALWTAEADRGNADAAIAGLRALVAKKPGDAQAWQELVPVMMRAGRTDEATKELQSAIERQPGSPDLLAILAALHRAANRPDDAQRALRQLLERAPSPTAYLALARHHGAQRDDAKMLEVLAEALHTFPDDPLLQRTHADALLSAGKLEDGRKAVDDYAARFPDDPNTGYLRARVELADGKTAAAAERLEQLLPRLDSSSCRYWLGRALEAAGDRTGAERQYELALGRDPLEPALYAPLIALSERRGDWHTSAGLGRRLIAIAPGEYVGWAALVGGLVQQGAGREAAAVARRAAKLFGDHTDAQLLLVRALRANREYDAALTLLGELDHRPGAGADVAAERVHTLGLAGRIEEGIQVAKTALATYPDSAALQTAFASLLFGAGRADEGAKAVDRALELEPEDLQPLAIRARFGAASGRLDGARKDAERYLERRPDDAQMHFLLGVVHEHAGSREPAIASYRRAAQLDPTAFEPRNNLALLLADEDLDGALAVAQEAYALRPKDPAVLDTVGELYLRKGLADRATSLLEEAHAGAPEEAEIQFHLALAHRQAGHTEDARRLLVALAGRDNSPPELRARIDRALRSLQ
jgi:tetratricopeptide (TPR) repeat protein